MIIGRHRAEVSNWRRMTTHKMIIGEITWKLEWIAAGPAERPTITVDMAELSLNRTPHITTSREPLTDTRGLCQGRSKTFAGRS